jgi:glycosyltransferase involved in cell wall biosynthesis
MDFLASIDVFSMPTAEREPKALPVLEALASGVPVVQPAHGIFPEMLDKTGGGILFSPENPASLTDCLENLISNPDRARQLGQEGREGVNKKCTAGHMASHTLDVYQQFL